MRQIREVLRLRYGDETAIHRNEIPNTLATEVTGVPELVMNSISVALFHSDEGKEAQLVWNRRRE